MDAEQDVKTTAMPEETPDTTSCRPLDAAGASGRPPEPALHPTGILAAQPTIVLSAWLGLAVALWLALYTFGRDMPFQEPHAWVSAHFSTIARSFVEHGVWQFIPVQNNDPMGASPDFYTHWPPLFAVTLSWLFAAFGESESLVRGFMLAILLANTGALMLLVRAIANGTAALAAGFFMLCSPVLEQYALIGLPMHLAILGMLLGILGFVRALNGDSVHKPWAIFGVASLMLGCMASWEPVLATPGLFVIALIQRKRASVVLSIIFGCAAAAAVMIVLGNYMIQLPALASDLWDTILVRIGMRDYPAEHLDIHFIVNREEYATYARPSAVQMIDTFGRRSLYLIGRLGLIALGWVFIAGWLHRRKATTYGPAYAVAGLTSAWACWFVLMNNHAFIHDFMMSLLVPAASVAVGLLATSMHRAIVSADIAPFLRRSMLAAVLVLTPLFLSVSLVRGVLSKRTPEPTGALVRYALAVNEHADEGAVVLSTSPSMVPVFYSRRHVIRAVHNDDILDEVLSHLAEEFPGAPAFMAIEPHMLPHFQRAASRHELVAESEELILLRLDVHSASGDLVRADS